MDVTQQYGYMDGSGTYRVLDRLQSRSPEESALVRRLEGLECPMKKLLNT